MRYKMTKKIIKDPLGNEIIIEEEKIAENQESMCKDCKYDWKNCDNDYIKSGFGENVILEVPSDPDGFPIILYCAFFKTK
jgi:hypothetical protein